MQPNYFHIAPFPTSRQSVIDAGYLANRRHIIHGLIEADITPIKSFIRDYKQKTGETLSFTAYLVMCLARAIQQHPHIQAYRGWRGHLVIYDAVDVVILIETEKNGVAIPHIIRDAHQKSLWDIHQEIRAIQTKRQKSSQQFKQPLAFKIPRFIRLPLMRLALKNPHAMKRNAGRLSLHRLACSAKVTDGVSDFWAFIRWVSPLAGCSNAQNG